jgi:hypothetical protein
VYNHAANKKNKSIIIYNFIRKVEAQGLSAESILYIIIIFIIASRLISDGVAAPPDCDFFI